MSDEMGDQKTVNDIIPAEVMGNYDHLVWMAVSALQYSIRGYGPTEGGVVDLSFRVLEHDFQRQATWDSERSQ